MYILENPVLQRELLINLRMPRAFVLLFLYQVLLGVVVYFAWPQESRLDLSDEANANAKRLADLFFVGQYVLASMMAPSFAAGTITGEKERKTYEMLLASPLRPAAIVLGKMLASLSHLAILIFASLPIIMLCLPLGGVSPFEVLAAYLGLMVSVVTFGMISIACSSYFHRTAASLVVSYLLILPLALIGVLFWYWAANLAAFRLLVIVTLVPVVGGAISLVLFVNTTTRLLHPPDVGSEGKDVVDLDHEAQHAVGLVIQPTQFPDRLFAPAKRDDLMDDQANPVYDKEVRSEIFSQGTLMLRLVIQVSMLLAIPLMAVCLYIFPQYSPWYIGYVVVFNMLVGPVFSAGSVTSERERQTLDLLLTTIITPWQILWGKLVAGLRISSVLTLFLLWPVLLACVMVQAYWANLGAVAGFLGVVGLACFTTANTALFCSVLFRKTSISLMVTYLIIILMFCVPLALRMFAVQFYEDHFDPGRTRLMLHLHDEGLNAESIAVRMSQYMPRGGSGSLTAASPTTAHEVAEALPRAIGNRWVQRLGITSPFSATFAIPLRTELTAPTEDSSQGDWSLFLWHLAFALAFNLGLPASMIWLFNMRWRVAE